MKNYIKIHHMMIRISLIHSFLIIASPIVLLSGCSTMRNADMGDIYQRCVSKQIDAMNLGGEGYYAQSNQLFDQISSECQSKYPLLEQQMNTTHYYKANNFEEMGNYARALAEYEAYLAFPNRFVYLDEPATIGRTLMKAKIDPANATAYLKEAESLLNKMSEANARYLVMKVNDAKYDLGIKDEKMLKSYIDAFEYVKNTSADAYNRPINLANLLGQKKVANEMAKRQQDMRIVDAKAKAMNIPGRLTTRDTSEKTLRMDVFYHEEFKKLKNSFFTNYYANMLSSDMKIQEMNANMARMEADLQRRNAEYEARKASNNNRSVPSIIGVITGAAVAAKTGNATLATQIATATTPEDIGRLGAQTVQEINSRSISKSKHNIQPQVGQQSSHSSGQPTYSSIGTTVSAGTSTLNKIDSGNSSTNTNNQYVQGLNSCTLISEVDDKKQVHLVNQCGKTISVFWYDQGNCKTGCADYPVKSQRTFFGVTAPVYYAVCPYPKGAVDEQGRQWRGGKFKCF